MEALKLTAFVLQAFVQGHPERIRRMVLVDSPGPTYTDADHANKGAIHIDSRCRVQQHLNTVAILRE